MTTPTNDAPVTVEQVDRETYKVLTGKFGPNAVRVDAGKHDDDWRMIEIVRHRLAARRDPAPAGDGEWQTVPVEMTDAMREAVMAVQREGGGWVRDFWRAALSAAALARPHSAVAPAGDGVEAATQMMRDCAHHLTSTASHHGQYAAIDQDKIDGLRDAVRDYDAALARPRAAVGEREA